MRTRITRLIRCITSKWFLLAWGALLVPGLASAQVAPTSVFQLDGNAANSSLSCIYDNGGATCDYWNLLNGAGAPTSPFIVTATQVPPNPAVSGTPGNWSARTFINGPPATFRPVAPKTRWTPPVGGSRAPTRLTRTP